MKTAQSHSKQLNFRLPTLPKHLEHREAHCDVHGDYIGVFSHKTNAMVGGCQFCESANFPAEIQKGIVQGYLQSAHIPEMYQHNSLVDYETKNEGQARSLKVARSFVEQYHQNKARALALIGSVGTGKTHLAIGIIKALINRGVPCRYTTVGDALAAVKETYGGQSHRTETEVINDYIRPDVLVLDEIGLRNLSEADKGLFYRIVDARYVNQKATIFLSNLDKEAFKKFVGLRVYDRLRSNDGRLISMFFDSYRCKN